MNWKEYWKIKIFLQENGGDWILWHINSWGASHMGGVWECQICSARSMLEGLLKTHSHSLNNESLATLMTGVESIINSRPLTVETINDPKEWYVTITKQPHSGEFSIPDLHSKRRWCHIADKVWNRWRKEFLQILQHQQEWKNKVQNFEIWGVALIKDDCHCNQWPLARVINTNNTDANKDIPTVLLRLADGKGSSSHILQQNITKIVLPVESDFDSPTKGTKQRFQDDCSSWESQMK